MPAVVASVRPQPAPPPPPSPRSHRVHARLAAAAGAGHVAAVRRPAAQAAGNDGVGALPPRPHAAAPVLAPVGSVRARDARRVDDRGAGAPASEAAHHGSMARRAWPGCACAPHAEGTAAPARVPVPPHMAAVGASPHGAASQHAGSGGPQDAVPAAGVAQVRRYHAWCEAHACHASTWRPATPQAARVLLVDAVPVAPPREASAA